MSEPLPQRRMAKSEFKRRSRRSFLGALAAALVGVGAWEWIRSRSLELELPWPFRRVLSWNEKIWRAYFRRERVPFLPKPPPVGKEVRTNGSEGLEDSVDFSAWRLEVQNLSLTIEDIKALPRTESTCLFKCIEGWSEEISYAGVRFSDFVMHYRLGTRSGKAPDWANRNDLFPYVGLKTPDGNYYVSLDTESLWHPNTVLAYEMNGAPLKEENGAPLRLIIPVKYGIKNLKRVGTIFFSDERPPDFWNEQGYDWYAGV